MSINALTGLLRQHIGLDPESIGQQSVSQSIQRRMDAVGVDSTDEYYLLVIDSPPEMTALIDEITVGETWFFREFRAFAILQEKALSSRINIRTPGPFRVASMPCSSGEEAYSIVMALMDTGLQEDQFIVDGFDINSEAIHKACKAEYGRASFRGTMPDFSTPYFDKTREGYRLKSSVKKCVDFHQANLLSLPENTESAPYDVIFCRNFLIYLDAESRRKMAKALRQNLKDDGLLIVGHCEAPSMAQLGFYTLDRNKRFCFTKSVNEFEQAVRRCRNRMVSESISRKFSDTNVRPQKVGNPGKKTASRNLKQHSAHQPAVKHQAPVSTLVSPQQSKSLVDKSSPAELEVLTGEELLEAIEGLVDNGKLNKARESCQQLIQQSPENMEAQFMMGVISEAEGEWEAASHCFRKVLYLNPEHHEALLHSAMVCERQGDMSKAENFRIRLRRLIS
ncbi:CheR family methyltransferase [Endozoicomonas atrinae]|uniref:CheR family methyltransferase n=1 Tax=Endozoicomonas atrinae TaxID=1333660 RepID=UPI0008268B5C|nr:protein-glutamate O-methyltransferase CheR [Endozoicomonas atrinae]